MGAAESQGVYSQIELNHPALRNCRALTKNNLTFLQASVTCQRPQFQQWSQQQNAFNLHEADSQYLLLPVKHKFQEGGVCSTAGELTIEYQYYPKLLSSEIQDRIHDKKRFSQAELWYLLYVMVSAREALVIQGMEVGNLQPRNIFLNANQQAKVANVLSWPGHISNYKSAVLEESFQYLSPEDIVRLKLGAMDNKNNTESEIFSMGLTLLQASCLQPMKDLYRLKHRDLDEELFGARLALFQHDRTYSQIYRAVVCNLLEMDPLKRMCQEELAELLFKHRENLQSKKPLMFDNVGKKLQQSINSLLKIVPPANPVLSSSNARGSRANSRTSREGPSPNQHINQLELNPQQALRQSSTHSVSKDKKIIINHELGGSNAKIPVSLTQNRKIIFNPTPQAHPPPVPLYMPPKPIYAQPEPSRNPPTFIIENPQTVGPKAQPTQKQVFRPFENIRAILPHNQSNQIQTQPFIEESKVQQIMAAQRTLEEGEQKSMVAQLMMETRRGFFVEMSRVERKQSKPVNLGQNSIIKNKADSSIVIQKPKSQLFLQVKPGEKEDGLQISYENPVSKQVTLNLPQPLSGIKQESKAIQETKELLYSLQKGQQGALQYQQQNIADLKSTEQEVKLITKVQSHQQQILIANQNPKLETQKVAAPSPPTKDVSNGSTENQKNSSYSHSRASSENKSSQTNKFAPTVKIWGMQKGKIVVHQVGTIQANIPKSTALQLHQIPQIPIKNEPQAPAKIQQAEAQVTNALAEAKIPQKQISSSDKYILIEQPSKNVSQIGNEPVTYQGSPPKRQVPEEQAHTTDNRNSRASNVGSQSSERLKLSTHGSFEQCWQELIKMTKEPHSYHNLIKPQKVEPLQNQYGQYLKVGPARMKVNLNKEQGKVWLQNLGSSLCEGDLLAGVVKKQDKLHYLWVNSSLKYKGKHFPNKQIIQEGLQIAQRNIQALISN